MIRWNALTRENACMLWFPWWWEKCKMKYKTTKLKRVWRYRPVYCDFERARAPRLFLFLGKRASYMKKLYISTGAFQGHQGNDGQGHRGIPLRCLREESGLKIPTETKHHTRVSLVTYQPWYFLLQIFGSEQKFRPAAFLMYVSESTPNLCINGVFSFTIFLQLQWPCYFLLIKCWDTPSANTGLWQLPKVPSAFIKWNWLMVYYI